MSMYPSNLNISDLTDVSDATPTNAQILAFNSATGKYEPAANIGADSYKELYNATTNTPTIIDGTGTNGDFYRVNVDGTQDFGSGNITFDIGDIVLYSGTLGVWEKVDGNPDLVSSVAGKTGAVTLDMDDLSETGTGKILTGVERTKLTGIETGATADQTDAEIKTAYENNADTNTFTDADEIKLDGIETSATGDQTGAEIKTAYEAEANAYTDTKDTKLSGIETSATGDQTGAEIKTAYEAEANAYTDTKDTKLTGIETSATADQTDAEIKTAYENNADTNAFTDANQTTLGNQTGTNTGDEVAATESVAGVLELATQAEADGGSDDVTALTSLKLAQSYAGTKTATFYEENPNAILTLGNDKAFIHIPEDMAGMNLVAVHARVITAGGSGLATFQIRNVTSGQDMLSTLLTIDAGETGSDTAATPAVIDTSEDDVAENDLLTLDIDTVPNSPPALGLIVTLTFRKP